MAANLKDLISYTQQFLGVDYVYGGETPKTGFDCSGLVRYVYGHFGVKLPRTSQDQARAGTAVSEKDLSPGDLILSNWGEGPNSHVAIYAGKGQLIEAPRTGLKVRVAPFNANYRAHTDGYRRVSSKKKGVIDTIEDITGDVVGGITGAVGDVLGAGKSLLSFPSEITGFFSEASSGLAATVEFFSAFFRPSTYVRIGAGLMGTVFLLAGIAFLIWEANQS